MLTMNIFMFSVSLLLAFHHIHLHHLYSILHFEQCWLASWKVGELNLGSEGIGSVQLTYNVHPGKSDVFVWKNPVVAAIKTCIQCCVQSVFLPPSWVPSKFFLEQARCFCSCWNTNGQVLIYTAGVILWHLLPSQRRAAAFSSASCSHSLSCAAAPMTWWEASLGSWSSWKITPKKHWFLTRAAPNYYSLS